MRHYGVMQGRTRRAVAGILLLAVLFSLFAATGAAASGFEEQFADIFLPKGEEIDHPQEFLFIMLAFMLTLAIFFYGIKQVLEDTPEAFVIALAISLFIIPSGGYAVISDFFMAIFGIGSAGLPGTGGEVPAGSQFLYDLIQETQGNEVYRAVATLLVGGLLALILGSSKFGTKGGIQVTEGIIIVFFMGTTWLALGGFETLMAIGGFLLVVSIGIGMIGIRAKRGGILASLIAVFGLIVIGWAFTNFGFLPTELQAFGDLLINAVGAFVISVVVIATVAIFILHAYVR